MVQITQLSPSMFFNNVFKTSVIVYTFEQNALKLFFGGKGIAYAFKKCSLNILRTFGFDSF